MADTRTYYKTVVTFKDINNRKISTRVISSFGFDDLGQIPDNATAFLLEKYKINEVKRLFKKEPKITETRAGSKAFLIGTYLTRQQIIDTYGKNSPEYQFILEEETSLQANRNPDRCVNFCQIENEGLPVSKDPLTGLYHYDGWYLLRNGEFAYGWGYACNLLDKSLVDSNGLISNTASINNSTIKPENLYYEEICSDEENYDDDNKEIE